MKPVIFKNSRNQSLVGILHTSNSKSIIIMSHPLANDKSGRGKFDEVAERLNKSGYNVLRFDFSGCGESDDDTLTIEKELDDLKSAIKFSKSLGYNNIGLFGHSIGALVSLKCYTPEIKTMFLWSPVTDKLKYDWNKKLSKEQLQELKEKGYYTRTRKNATRTVYKIDKQMLKERESLNQEGLLKNITCPVLILQGTKDESIPIEDSENAIKLLSKESQLKIIDGANHDFNDHLDVIVEASNNWFEKNLSK
jgi:pimeloyl-ACP methyl ester carboxylesterase